MGCCSSSGKQNVIDGAVNNAALKEDKIELVFKAKRANVFSEGLSLNRPQYVSKKIEKTTKQAQVIRNALMQNYIFSNLSENDVLSLIDSMEILDVSRGEHIITQGQQGDYFYIVDRGAFTVIVNDKPVAQLGEGKSFGELALLYNSPRQATIRAETAAVLFSLDRETFRYTLASSSSNNMKEIKNALSKVPLLSGLTDEQFSKLCDTVEIVPYNSGDNIIRKGADGNIFYMIKSGTVKVSDVGSQFSDHTLTAGEYFGERALLTGEPRAANVNAVTDCILLALDRESFNSLLGPLREVLDRNMNMRIISSIKLFDKLTLQEKAKVAVSFEFETFAAGVTIIKEGDKGKKFYILKEGSAKVVLNGNNVGELTSGQYFGEMALLDDEVRKASVIAKVDCECFALDRTTFNRLMGSLQNIIKRETNERMEQLRLSSIDSADHLTNIRFEDLQNLALLGSGTFGKVTLVQDKNTKNVYALKTMLKSEIVIHKQQNNVMNEKNIMIQCNHPFILKLYQTYKDQRKLHMLLEFVQGGELFSVLHTPQNDGVPDGQAKFYGVGVLLAIAYLHGRDIAYRDMKPENCLVDKFGYPKLVDFGFAKVIQGKTFTLCGTPEYLSPELVLGRGHTKSVDYWAYGILLYEMEAGYSPFSDPQGMDQVVICKNIVNGRLVFPRNFNPDCKDLVKKLLAREVQSRLGNLKGGTDDIKNHRWFQGYDFEGYMKKQMRAPWVPKVSSATDVSNFDPYGEDDHPDEGFVDNGIWDKDF